MGRGTIRSRVLEWTIVIFVAVCLITLSATILLIWSFTATAISAATHSDTNRFFIITANYVLDLIGVDRSRVAEDAYLSALNQVSNALSIIFAVIVTALPFVAFIVTFAKRRFTADETQSILGQYPTPEKLDEFRVLEPYYKEAERIVVYAGDFSWLADSPVLATHVLRLSATDKIRLISSKDQEHVKKAIGSELYGSLFKFFTFNDKKNIRCSIITFPGGTLAFLYRYWNNQEHRHYICAVHDLPSSSYLLRTIETLCYEPEPQRVAIFICGLPGTGKTVAANALRSLGFKIVSAGALMRKLAEEQATPLDRVSLIKFGETYLRNYGISQFADALLEMAGSADRVAFEGIRPFEAVVQIKKRYSVSRVMFLRCDEAKREERLARAKGEDERVFAAIAASPMEKEVTLIRSIADQDIANTNMTFESFEEKIRSYAMTLLISS